MCCCKGWTVYHPPFTIRLALLFYVSVSPRLDPRSPMSHCKRPVCPNPRMSLSICLFVYRSIYVPLSLCHASLALPCCTLHPSLPSLAPLKVTLSKSIPSCTEIPIITLSACLPSPLPSPSAAAPRPWLADCKQPQQTECDLIW